LEHNGLTAGNDTDKENMLNDYFASCSYHNNSHYPLLELLTYFQLLTVHRNYFAMRNPSFLLS